MGAKTQEQISTGLLLIEKSWGRDRQSPHGDGCVVGITDHMKKHDDMCEERQLERGVPFMTR